MDIGNLGKPRTSIQKIGESLNLTKDEIRDLREITLEWLNSRIRSDEVLAAGREWRFLTRLARLLLEKHGARIFKDSGQGRLVWQSEFKDQQQRLVKYVTEIMHCQLYYKSTSGPKIGQKQQTETVEDRVDDDSESSSSCHPDLREDRSYNFKQAACKSFRSERHWTRSNTQPGMPALPSVETSGPVVGDRPAVDTVEKSRKRNLLDIETFDSVRNNFDASTQKQNLLISEWPELAIASQDSFARARSKVEAFCIQNSNTPSNVQIQSTQGDARMSTKRPGIIEEARSCGRALSKKPDPFRSLLASAWSLPPSEYNDFNNDPAHNQLAVGSDSSTGHNKTHNRSNVTTQNGLPTPSSTFTKQSLVTRLYNSSTTVGRTDSSAVRLPSPAKSSKFPLHLGGDHFKLVNEDCSVEILQRVVDFFRTCEEECQRGARQALDIKQRRVFELNRVFLQSKLQELYSRAELWSGRDGEADVDSSAIVIS